MEQYINILYPEKRKVSEEEIMTWASDAWFNEAPKYRCPVCGQVNMPLTCKCSENSIFEPEWEKDPPITIEEAMEFLSDLGLVTFSKNRKED